MPRYEVVGRNREDQHRRAVLWGEDRRDAVEKVLGDGEIYAVDDVRLARKPNRWAIPPRRFAIGAGAILFLANLLLPPYVLAVPDASAPDGVAVYRYARGFIFNPDPYVTATGLATSPSLSVVNVAAWALVGVAIVPATLAAAVLLPSGRHA